MWDIVRFAKERYTIPTNGSFIDIILALLNSPHTWGSLFNSFLCIAICQVKNPLVPFWPLNGAQIFRHNGITGEASS